jgi:hypothetical protein
MYAVMHMLQDKLRKLVVILSKGSIDRLLIPHTPCIILVPVVVSFVSQHHVTASDWGGYIIVRVVSDIPS